MRTLLVLAVFFSLSALSQALNAQLFLRPRSSLEQSCDAAKIAEIDKKILSGIIDTYYKIYYFSQDLLKCVQFLPDTEQSLDCLFSEDLRHELAATLEDLTKFVLSVPYLLGQLTALLLQCL